MESFSNDGSIVSSQGVVLVSGIDKSTLNAFAPAGFLILPDCSVTDLNGNYIGAMDVSTGYIVLPNGAVYSGSGDLLIPPTILSSAEIPLSSTTDPLSSGVVIPTSSASLPNSSAVVSIFI
jgi:hypothetical protein